VGAKTHTRPSQQDTLELSVRTCLKYALESESPFRTAGEFFAALKADSRWTDAEVTEIQNRVLTKLTSANQE